MLMNRTSMGSGRLPGWFILSVIAVCMIPTLLNLLGFDFSSAGSGTDLLPQAASISSEDVVRSGIITHTLLEWMAFSAAFFTVILAFAHYQTTRDVVTPVIAIALFFAGSIDAFHILAADRLIEAVADNRDLIPFTWALCRMFNSLIMIMGISILLFSKEQRSNSILIVSISIFFGVLASWSVTWAITSENLPQTTYPEAFITRPFDVAPLLLFMFAGLFLYPRIHQIRPTLFTHALIISAIPEVVVQIHMAFGSTSLFDNHFNIAHFLKIVAYLVPFLGLCLEHVRISLEEVESKKRILGYQREAAKKNQILERTVKNLKQEAEARMRVTEELQDHKSHLKELVHKRTRKLHQAMAELREESGIRRNTEEALRANQEMLVQTEKMASIGQLAAGIAHEINNPTGYIVSNLETLAEYVAGIKRFLIEFQGIRSQIPDSRPIAQSEAIAYCRNLSDSWERECLDYIVDDASDLVDQTREGAQRIVKIISDLNSFARSDDDEIVDANINECLDTTLNIVRNELRYKCDVSKYYAELPSLACNPGRLSQVFVNILVNAAQAITDHGRITVTSECDLDEIRVKFSDDGMGISPENQRRIFDPFFTTKEVGAGTGLGLSVSHGIVKKHGGFIEVESALDLGTCFTVHLPLKGCSRSDTAGDAKEKS